MARVLVGTVEEILPTLDAESFDAVLCDPPYGLKFMGQAWDHGVPGAKTWREVARVLRPGAHLIAFGGTRTYHRLTCAIEDAGFEIRDALLWLHGQGFPKSLDVSKAIDKAAGAVRQRVAGGQGGANAILGARKSGEAISGEAILWSGYGTMLKPAWEPAILARKPLDGTVSENVQKHGTGAINVDGCRVDMGAEYDPTKVQRQGAASVSGFHMADSALGKETPTYKPLGRFPANVVLDEEAALALDEMSGERTSGRLGPEHYRGQPRFRNAYGDCDGSGARVTERMFGGDSGGASRFFYTSKASRSDRGPDNRHPTVKPVNLCRWLARLILPPSGIGRPRRLLVPFAGSGSEMLGAICEGWDEVIGIEVSEAYATVARQRIRDEAPLLVELSS